MQVRKNFWAAGQVAHVAGPIIEVSRMNIQAGGREVYIDYGEKAGVRFREYE